MSAQHVHRSRGVRRGRRGFTLIELIAVTVIVAIMAGVSVPAFSSISQTRTAAAARDVHRDLAWARQHAVATGRRTWVVFDAIAESWTVLAELPGNPGRSNAVVLTDVATGTAWTRATGESGYADVEIVSIDFDGDDEIGFDWLGRPLNALESDLAAEGTITLSSGYEITVAVESGLPQYVAP